MREGLRVWPKGKLFVNYFCADGRQELPEEIVSWRCRDLVRRKHRDLDVQGNLEVAKILFYCPALMLGKEKAGDARHPKNRDTAANYYKNGVPPPTTGNSIDARVLMLSSLPAEAIVYIYCVGSWSRFPQTYALC